MDQQWFWQTAGEQYGPLSIEEIEDLVRRGRVSDDDQIRLDGSADWLPAVQVKAMFKAPVAPEAGDSEAPETGAQSAARVLAGLERRQLEREADEVSWGSRLAGLAGKGSRGPAAVVAVFRDWIAAGLAGLLGLFARKTTLAVIAVLLLAVLFRNVELGDSQAREAHAELAAAFEQMQAMKKRGASQAEWQEFERETLEWLKPMLQDLGESAVRNERGYDLRLISQFNTVGAHRNLVGAGWALAEAISDARESKQRAKAPAAERPDGRGQPIPALPPGQIDDPPEAVFSKRMDIAQGFMDGQIKEITTSAPTKAGTGSIDPMIAGMIVIDVGVVGGALAFWWKRRRRKK